MPDNQDVEYWLRFLKAWRNYVVAQRNLIDNAESLVEIVRHGLSQRTQFQAAFDIARYLKVEQLQELFDLLLAHAIQINGGGAGAATKLILKLPHDWLLENIETHAETVFNSSDAYDYEGLFGLYCEIDVELAKRLVQRALTNPDPEIKEFGTDAAESLGMT